jgi:hypothetical protein
MSLTMFLASELKSLLSALSRVLVLWVWLTGEVVPCIEENKLKKFEDSCEIGGALVLST